MILAWLDPRPFLGLALLPIAAVCGYLVWRFAFRSSSWLICQIASFAVVFAVYQFVFYGPFIGNKRLVHVDAIVTWRTDMGPDVIGFTLPKSFGFGDIISRDMDVADRIRERNLREVELGVELFYDFGSMRGMNLAYAYADGIIFSPHKQ